MTGDSRAEKSQISNPGKRNWQSKKTGHDINEDIRTIEWLWMEPDITNPAEKSPWDLHFAICSTTSWILSGCTRGWQCLSSFIPCETVDSTIDENNDVGLKIAWRSAWILSFFLLSSIDDRVSQTEKAWRRNINILPFSLFILPGFFDATTGEDILPLSTDFLFTTLFLYPSITTTH